MARSPRRNPVRCSDGGAPKKKTKSVVVRRLLNGGGEVRSVEKVSTERPPIRRPRQRGHWLARAAAAYHLNSRKLIGSISRECALGNISNSKAYRLIEQVEGQWSRMHDFLDKVGEEIDR